jgi:large repetitive protein
VVQRLADAGVSHGPLDDVVTVATGGFGTFGVLLFVDRAVLEGKRVVVRALAADGTELEAVVVTAANLIWTQPLPQRWTDPSGPWYDDVADLLSWVGRSKTVPVYVELRKHDDAARVEIGTRGGGPRPDFRKPTQQPVVVDPPFYVAAMSEVKVSEILRSGWDDDQVTRDRETLIKAMGPDSSKNSLLYADAL